MKYLNKFTEEEVLVAKNEKNSLQEDWVQNAFQEGILRKGVNEGELTLATPYDVLTVEPNDYIACNQNQEFYMVKSSDFDNVFEKIDE